MRHCRIRTEKPPRSIRGYPETLYKARMQHHRYELFGEVLIGSQHRYLRAVSVLRFWVKLFPGQRVRQTAVRSTTELTITQHYTSSRGKRDTCGISQVYY